MKAQCVYLTPDFAKTIKFYSTWPYDPSPSRTILLCLNITITYSSCYVYLFDPLSLFSSHWPALAGAVYSSHSDSVFADQTQDHRKVSSFPSLFYLLRSLFLTHYTFIYSPTLLFTVLNDETSQDTAVDNSADFSHTQYLHVPFSSHVYLSITIQSVPASLNIGFEINKYAVMKYYFIILAAYYLKVSARKKNK